MSGCGALDTVFCDTEGCELSAREWVLLQSLAGLPEAPPEDSSNRYLHLPAAQGLGQLLYFDARFSGPATVLDSLRRPMAYARAPKGQPTDLSCASCHNPARAGADFTSTPNHVSIGAGWYDVNGQQTVNAAYYRITYWNGRNDSLWAQIVAVAESFVSMGSNRLKISWLLQDKYRATYDVVFTEWPLPLEGSSSDVRALLVPDALPDGTPNPLAGQCALASGVCAAPCRSALGTDGATSCWPRFPLQGRPGATAGCQSTSAAEPFHDAFDCMADADREAITRVLVNYAKAIAAYEQRLVSRDAPFDRWVEEGPASGHLTAEQVRGARLFVGKASCIDCHQTPLFSDSDFHNVGVPQTGEGVPTVAECLEGTVCDCVQGRNCLPWGARDGLTKLRANGFRRDSRFSDDPADTSRQDYLERELDASLEGAWRTPSLRDVELTAPYMHDGVYQTLDEVVAHYDRGGSLGQGVGTPAVQVKPLFLTAQEKADLVAFLRSLTGTPLARELVVSPELPP
ncbi:MAG: hypothetical protein AMXMBFR34_23390 [Myxococcaceae bacterium]